MAGYSGMAAALILLLGYMFRNLTQLDSIMHRSPEYKQQICWYSHIWHIPEAWGSLEWLNNCENTVIQDITEKKNPEAHKVENYLDACILIEIFNSLKNVIQPSCQIKLVHEMTQGQDSCYLLMVSIVARNFTQYSHNLANPACLYDHQLAVSLKEQQVSFAWFSTQK